MPIYRERYADDWDDIALAAKAAASWRCRHCNQQCLRPGEKPKELSRSEWTVLTLSVHHATLLCTVEREAERIPHLGS